MIKKYITWTILKLKFDANLTIVYIEKKIIFVYLLNANKSKLITNINIKNKKLFKKNKFNLNIF